jgi:hypothetical protein
MEAEQYRPAPKGLLLATHRSLDFGLIPDPIARVKCLHQRPSEQPTAEVSKRGGMYERQESEAEWLESPILRHAELRGGGTVPDEFAGIKRGLGPRGGRRIVSQAR